MANDEQNFFRFIFIVVILSIVLPMPKVFSQEASELDLRLQTIASEDERRDELTDKQFDSYQPAQQPADETGMITIFYSADGVQHRQGYVEVWKPSENWSVDLYRPEETVGGGVKLKYSM